MTDERPPNHFAFVALDDNGGAYVVLEPLDPNESRLERSACPLSARPLGRDAGPRKEVGGIGLQAARPSANF